ncbi:YlzJ-like family protein [Bacillus sp. AGMB 02131]|uniref:YlzJ-like family protein n=1 Tax=Peribacillus faecalis TaxID=2772559 RepID=A0A927CYE0_9BACI|nr:YlzJ-like family protein [Peribacillus faecalis]MBD3109384.1 YlzJ-like family protein [Peribacillus faecalis]
MILYTIVPHEIIYESEQEFKASQENVYYNGVLVTVERLAVNRYQIVSILSTDPKDYLREELQPGKMIEIPLIRGV